MELKRVHLEQENLEKHLSLISFSKDNILKTSQELEGLQGKRVQGKDLQNKLENFKRQEEELKEQTEKLSGIKVTYPSVEYSIIGFEDIAKNAATISHRAVVMANKKICFFGDNNRVLSFDIQTEKWRCKTLNRSSFEFPYYASCVTLPNGDALIIGGGSSAAVFQYSVAKEEL